ncbi:hypothetical protein HanPSC8_Chr05g0207371 [Helianthus annuus]|nr:hypothetical protein HanPSC8_Chr05g0207371 [Helianthus annuus]
MWIPLRPENSFLGANLFLYSLHTLSLSLSLLSKPQFSVFLQSSPLFSSQTLIFSTDQSRISAKPKSQSIEP